MSETLLHGGDVNVVVRVGDTVRRPTGPWSPAVHALLRHFEAAGFDGAPRFLGTDEEGREILSYVEGEAALPPVPAGDDLLRELGRLLRRMHDAQAGFEPPRDATWFFADARGPLVCHNDPFPPNVILRDGLPAALVDWDLAAPGERLDDVAAAAYHWAPLRTPDWAEEYGLPVGREAERVRILCDAYGLGADERARFVDRSLAQRERGYELHELFGARERLPGWREMWDEGSGERIRANARWIEEHRAEIEAALG